MGYGIFADYTIFQSIPSLQPEFMCNHQPTELGAAHIATDTREDLTSADLDMYQWGFNYTLRDPEKHIRPYVVGGLGFTHFSGGVPALQQPFFLQPGRGSKVLLQQPRRISAGGSMVAIAYHVWTEEVDSFRSRTFGVCNHAQQGEANLGLIFRFKGPSS